MDYRYRVQIWPWIQSMTLSIKYSHRYKVNFIVSKSIKNKAIYKANFIKYIPQRIDLSI